MSVIIRDACVDDVPLILSFVRALAEYEKLSHEVEATEDRLRATLFPRSAGHKPSAEVLIAEIDGRAVGFALFFSSYSTFLAKPGVYLEDLFVLPSERGHGVGRKLLARLATLVLERGGGRLEWSVLNWNTPAIEFYRSLGAKPMEGWTVNRLTGEALERLSNL